jgi:DNA-binding CsgD family transcriptional regulator
VEVLRASGEQWEALVSYGVVDQVVRVAGFGGTGLLTTRPRAPSGVAPVGERILDVLGELEVQGTVAVVIDDAHWADVDSLRALLFAHRRLVTERVLAILVVRPDEATRLPDGLRRMAAGPTGVTVRLGALEATDIRRLASALGFPELPARVAQRLHAHTRGNPLYAKALLAELPADRWRNWQPVLPAPHAFSVRIVGILDACSLATRRLIEAAAVLGGRVALTTAATLAGSREPLAELEEAVAAGLLDVRQEPGIREVSFPHPLIRAAVHEQLGPVRRVDLHVGAAALVEDPGAALRHRVAAAAPPDPELAAQLDAFAEREAHSGAWANAAAALVDASRFSPAGADRERRLLRAVDAMVGSGDLAHADSFAREIAGFEVGPMRDATLGYLAILQGHPREADKLLGNAWRRCDAGTDAHLAAVVAQRRALHAVGHMRAGEMVDWARRAVALAPAGHGVRNEAEAVLDLGLSWLGRGPAPPACEDPPPTDRQMAHGWRRLATGDLPGARAALTEAASAGHRSGSTRSALWAFCWLSRTDFALGAWDDAVADAEHALGLVDETGQEWLRPLARWAAAAVPIARGEWAVAREHVHLATAHPGDYELSIAAAGMARAQLAATLGDHDGVLHACEALLEIRPRDALDEPGFWPWTDLYADALVSAGRVDEAEAFLGLHEQRAAQRQRHSVVAGLARVRGRVEVARNRPETAEAAFRRGLEQLGELPLPYDRALLELTFGQVLRRQGRRRAAADQLRAAHERFTALRARPYLDRCERELVACGLSATRRRDFDPHRLTAQENAVARLVADGRTNRQVAEELVLSIKTVQFHLTHIYAKFEISSRGELAARLRDGDDATTDPDPL